MQDGNDLSIPAAANESAEGNTAKFRIPKSRAPLLRKEQECCSRATD